MADEFGRTTWDNFNMAIAMLVTSRSIDPRTKHGCYIIDKNNKPLSFGYNGPLRGSDDKKVSWYPPEGERDTTLFLCVSRLMVRTGVDYFIFNERKL